MRLTFRFHFALILTGLLIVPAMELLAQQSAKPGSRTAPSNAQSKPAVQKAAPKEEPPASEDADDEEARRKEELKRLDAILTNWEAASSKIKSLHGKQSRSEVNHVFNSEKVTEGPFFLEMPDKGRIDFTPIKVKPGMCSKITTKPTDGSPPVPYTLQTGNSERWVCTGDMVIQVDDEKKTYQKDIIPEEQRGKNIVESPLPFLFGMTKQDAKARFKLSVLNENKDFVRLLAIPKMAKDIENYEKAAITLDKKTYLPTRVHLIDQSKNEMVYSFQSVVVNDTDIRSRLAGLFNVEKDPFRLNLKGYTAVLPPEVNVAVDGPGKAQAAQAPKKAAEKPNPKDSMRR